MKLMFPDAVAVITYPGHCITTALTIKNLLELTNWQVPFYVFVDDQGEQYRAWPGDYLEDIKQYYSECFPQLNIRYVKFSEFKFSYIYDGWLRQQMVKLNLDRFLPGSVYYVTDGDVYCKELLLYGTTPYNYVPARNQYVHAQNKSYLSYILKTSAVTVERDNRLIFTHHAPFRWIEKLYLQRLREYVSKIHVNDFNLVHIRLIREEQIIGLGPTADYLSMTEWDLYEIFRTNILQQDIGLEYWPPGAEADLHKQSRFWTFFGTDRDIDPEWFAKYNLKIPKYIQHKVQAISRT